MNTERTNRVVLITGATGGLGGAVVRAFADQGRRLILTGRRQVELETTAAALELGADRVLLLPVNLTARTEVEQMARAASERFGASDVLVHVAGGFKAGAPVAETDVETWNFMLNLNLFSAFLAARAVLPGMLHRGYGKLVFISSKAGSQPGANMAAYGVSKGGVELLGRSCPSTAGPKNVKRELRIKSSVISSQYTVLCN
jgi:NADP-dependent 3-hydroxy acid dehydrogenase YdfG